MTMTSERPAAPPTAIARPTPPNDLRSMLLIARRAALEALRDRMTVMVSLLFALALPLFLVLVVIRPMAAGAAETGEAAMLSRLLAFYVLLVGLLPSSAAVGIAACPVKWPACTDRFRCRR